MMVSVVMFLAVLLRCSIADFEVATGSASTCATYNGEVKCWGSFAVTGQGDGNELSAPPQEVIDLGSSFSADAVRCGYRSFCCALSDDHRLKCWGAGTGFGYPGTTIGDEDGEMGDDLAYLPFENVDDFNTFGTFTCILSEGEVQCFGIDDRFTGLEGPDDYFAGWAPDEYFSVDDPITLDFGNFAVSRLSGGMRTVCAISTDGDLKCLGAMSKEGAMSKGFSNDFQVERVECNCYHCCALSGGDDAGKLECWGDVGDVIFPDGYGMTETSNLDSSFVVKDFSVGFSATCALSTGGQVTCFGRDAKYQLGSGSVPGSGMDSNFESKTFAIGDEFTASGVHLAHGESKWHFCLYEHGDELLLRCWGNGDSGQNGYGFRGARPYHWIWDDLEYVDLGCWTGQVFMSCFHWPVANGVWHVLPGQEDVYFKVPNGWTSPIYMWKLSNVMGGWGAWVIGYDYTVYNYIGWKWGDDLLDCKYNLLYCDHRLLWQHLAENGWADNADAGVNPCLSATPSCSAGVSISMMSNGSIPNGTHTIPMFDGVITAAVSPVSEYGVFPEIAAGVAVSVMILVAIAIAVSVRRKRNDCPQTGGAVHVPEVSPMDIAVQIEMGKEAVGSVETVTAEIETGNEAAVEMEDDGAADVVVDDVAPKPDEAVSVGHEQ